MRVVCPTLHGLDRPCAKLRTNHGAAWGWLDLSAGRPGSSSSSIAAAPGGGARRHLPPIRLGEPRLDRPQ